MTTGVVIGPLGDGDVAPVAAFVAACQRDPEQHVVLASTDPATVAADLAGVAAWRDRLLVARADGEVVGALLADLDDGRPRVWWWGPWAIDEPVARALLAAGDRLLGSAVTEQEYAPDLRNLRLRRLADERGARPGTASAVLTLQLDGVGGAARPSTADAPAGTPVAALSADHRAEVAALHDLLFPGTHTTGAQLVDPTADREVLVVAVGDAVLGYVACELEADGSGYVDFLGVAPAARRRGLGRTLVLAAVERFAAQGVREVAITVRVDNTAARALYDAVGFVEERIAEPWRSGFDLG